MPWCSPRAEPKVVRIVPRRPWREWRWRKTTRLVAGPLPQESGLRLSDAGTGRALGELTLHGPLNLGRIRPTGLAFAPERSLLAMANRTGGVHLIALRLRNDLAVPTTGLADAGGDRARR